MDDYIIRFRKDKTTDIMSDTTENNNESTGNESDNTRKTVARIGN